LYDDVLARNPGSKGAGADSKLGKWRSNGRTWAGGAPANRVANSTRREISWRPYFAYRSPGQRKKTAWFFFEL